jgi:predicted permease
MSVVLFAFGELALSFAGLFFVASAVLAYTVGIVIASLGSASIPQAVINLFKVPMIYALLLAVLFMRTGWQVPLPLERTTTLLGNAAIPAMLVLLGMRLTTASWSNKAAPLAIAGTMRLLVSPTLALLLAPVFGIAAVARQAVVLEAAMPTAVLTTVLATEYDANPSFVSAAVFLSTLLSPISLTPLLAYLGA